MGLGQRALACLIALLLINAGVNAGTGAQTGPDDPGFEFQWALTQIAVQDAWEIGRGRGVSVAVLDTGVDLAHEDLNGRLLSGGRDTVGDDSSPQDDRGEGTHLAGIIAASTNNRTGIAGIAHEAKVLPVKVLDSEGSGFEADVLEGIRFAIEKKVDVLLVNLDERIILTGAGSTFENAIRDAWSAGIVPVISADHAFVRSAAFSDAPALVVGGVTREGSPSPESSGVGAAAWGISAPGGAGGATEDDIFSTYLPGRRTDRLGRTRDFGRYVYDSGDIQAAAHVAGAAAILRGLGQTAEQSVERILSSATDAGPTGRDRTFGVGVLHAGKSVRGLAAQQPAGAQGAPTTSGGSGGSPSATSAPARGASGQQGSQPGRVAPDGSGGPPATSGVGVGPPPPSVPSAAELDPESDASADAGRAARGVAPRPTAGSGRTPLLPLVAFLLLVGCGTITWALRRRAVDPKAPFSS